MYVSDTAAAQVGAPPSRSRLHGLR